MVTLPPAGFFWWQREEAEAGRAGSPVWRSPPGARGLCLNLEASGPLSFSFSIPAFLVWSDGQLMNRALLAVMSAGGLCSLRSPALPGPSPDIACLLSAGGPRGEQWLEGGVPSPPRPRPELTHGPRKLTLTLNTDPSHQSSAIFVTPLPRGWVRAEAAWVPG